MSKKYKENYELPVTKEMMLLEFLYSNIVGKSKNNIKTLLKKGNILVNNKVVTQFNYQLKKGQIVMVKLAQIQNAKNDSLDIIYEDDDIIVVNKKEGILSISTTNEKTNTVYKMVMDYVKKQNPRLKIFIVHRLDRDTSGVIMFAKKENVKLTLQNNWNSLVKKRYYIGVVEGIPNKDKDTIKSRLAMTKTNKMYSVKMKGVGKEAITNYEVIKKSRTYSMLKIDIETGRKNQIRVHMQDIGHSIIGDKSYGATTNPIKRLGLHAHILEIEHPITKHIMQFEAEVPSNFISLFK